MEKNVEILINNYQNNAEILKTDIMHFKKGFGLAPHYHAFFHINFVVSGQVEIDTDGKVYTIDKGKLFVLPPNKIHSTYTDIGYTQVGMDLQYIEGGTIFPMLLNVVSSGIKIYDLSYMLEDYLAYFSNIQPSKIQRMMLNNFSERLLITALSLEQSSTVNTEFCNKLTAVLQDAKYNISVQELCKKLFISKTSLERYMHSNFSMSAKGYLNFWRLSKIYYYLLETELKIDQIAREMDFYDTAHFITFFKRHTGKTPTEFRKKEKNNASSNMLP